MATTPVQTKKVGYVTFGLGGADRFLRPLAIQNDLGALRSTHQTPLQAIMLPAEFEFQAHPAIGIAGRVVRPDFFLAGARRPVAVERPGDRLDQAGFPGAVGSDDPDYPVGQNHPGPSDYPEVVDFESVEAHIPRQEGGFSDKVSS